jgi:hypothetical protein
MAWETTKHSMVEAWPWDGKQDGPPWSTGARIPSRAKLVCKNRVGDVEFASQEETLAISHGIVNDPVDGIDVALRAASVTVEIEKSNASRGADAP